MDTCKGARTKRHSTQCRGLHTVVVQKKYVSPNKTPFSSTWVEKGSVKSHGRMSAAPKADDSKDS